jgi:hypothetical protein
MSRIERAAVTFVLASMASPAWADEPSVPFTCDEIQTVRPWSVGSAAPEPVAAADAASVAVRLDATAPLTGPALVVAVAAANAAGARCLVLPGQSAPAAVRVIVDLPPLDDPDGLALLGHAPIVFWQAADEVILTRWPLPGVSLAAADSATLETLLEVERRNEPGERDAVVHVEPEQSAAAIGRSVALLLKHGVRDVALHVGPSRWAPLPALRPDIALWKKLPVTTTGRVFFGTDGELDIQFPAPPPRPMTTLALEDVLGYQETCAHGLCDVVVVTAAERFFVLRRPDAGPADLTHRFLFGAAVSPYEGPGLGSRIPPKTVGRPEPLARVEYSPPADKRQGEPGYISIIGSIDRVRVEHVLGDRAPLMRECFVGEASAYWGAGLARNPFGSFGVGFTVGADGHVVAIEVTDDTIDNHHLQACVLDAMRSTRFPHSADGNPVRIDYRMAFGTRD